MKKIGILGGGQLGRMFLQAAINYPYKISFLDPSPNAPCAFISKDCYLGNFNNYENVINFGLKQDVISIEIEHINIDALYKLESLGKKIIPKPDILSVIKDKGLQKKFYQKNSINTVPFYLIDKTSDIDTSKINYPFVQKTRTGGYDGKGVQVIGGDKDLENLWDTPSVIEKLEPIEKEIAILIAKDQFDNIRIYDPVEMVFDQKLNLVDYLVSPANITKDQLNDINALARKLINKINSPGLFAIEVFITSEKNIYVNEIAPRPHNSYHGSIEACETSQFDQLLRILAGLPLGSPTLQMPYLMMNILGDSENSCGFANVDGLDLALSLKGAFIHWYGKQKSSPGRKMGHITLTGSIEESISKMQKIKQNIKVTNKNKLCIKK